jgi:tRNA(fMet)-specific endonuclease VapC
MRYLTDTNIWILYLKQRNSAVEDRLRSTPAGEVAVCSVVRAELLHGARKYGNVANRVALVEETLAPYLSLPFDDQAAYHYAEVRHHLESVGAVIGANDLLIASVARAHGLVMATGNVREFQRIPGLAVEDWTLP